MLLYTWPRVLPKRGVFKENMTIFRLIPAKWTQGLVPLEGHFSDDEILKYNAQGYNIYYFPNYPSSYIPPNHVKANEVDTFKYVFVDCDLKSGDYSSKEDFLVALDSCGITPTTVIDSGRGVHAYWHVSNLDAKSFLRFQRRLCRLLVTDEAVSRLNQLMRYPETINTKDQHTQVLCTTLYSTDKVYTAEELDSLLPPIMKSDEEYCEEHYNKAHNINQDQTEISDKLPAKFGQLLRDNSEAKELFAGNVDDRSKADYRLGHLMFANGFTRDDALSVLVNSVKAMERAPTHRRSYAINIVDKIWTFELNSKDKLLTLSSSVKDILQRSGETLKGTPFRCHPRIDNTEHGFRLGQVIGLVAGSGVGKTSFALNMFRWFTQSNPDYHHFFIPLEQPANEIADRWKTMCGEDTSLHDKVHVLSNYAEDGSFRHLSFDEIKEYVRKFQDIKKVKIGCIVVDHIGALKKKGKDGENQDLMDICHSMKAFAVETNTLLVMQSQSSREKAGIGDLELDKDAAYGTVYFESYCDYLVAIWQPLKRCHAEPNCPTVTAFKFCKIRHKKPMKDIIQEDVAYYVYFDSNSERIEDLTENQKTSFNYFIKQATNKRKLDKKSDIAIYKSVPYNEVDSAAIKNN